MGKLPKGVKVINRLVVAETARKLAMEETESVKARYASVPDWLVRACTRMARLWAGIRRRP